MQESRPRAPGRGEKVRRAVLAAARAELADRGHAATTVDGVARRAGVHKTTIYRRWADVDALLVDALVDHVDEHVPISDSGDLGSDLRETARRLVTLLTSDPLDHAVTTALYSATTRPAELAGIRQRIFEDRLAHVRPVVERAVARGELPAGTDPGLLGRALIAPIYLRRIVLAEPIDHGTADHAAAIALAAARAGVFCA